jgi:alginate O-acetyltransferase complex protein AlgI
LIIMETIHYFQRNRSIRLYLSKQNQWLRWGAYLALVSWILLFGAFDKPAQFIYFQF